MLRRGFLKGLAAFAFVAAVAKGESPRTIYLRSGERLSGKTFTRDVTVYMEGGAVIEDCRFRNATLTVEEWNGGGEKYIRNCSFVGAAPGVAIPQSRHTYSMNLPAQGQTSYTRKEAIA